MVLSPELKPVHVHLVGPGTGGTGGVETAMRRLIAGLDQWGVPWTMTGFRHPMGLPHGGGSIALLRCRAAVERVFLSVRAAVDVAGVGRCLVHVHGTEYGWALAAAQRVLTRLGLGPLWDGNLVVTAHGVLHHAYLASLPQVRWWSRRVARMIRGLEAMTLSLADRVCAVAPTVADDLVAEFSLAPGRVVVVPNSIDGERFRPLGDPTGRDGILWVGRDERGKDLDRARALLRRLRRRRPVVLTIAGDVARHEEEGVRLAGVATPDEMVDLYRATRVFLSTSKYEADPVSVKEALACGVPVVVTPAASAVVQHDVNGYICSNDDEMVEAIARLLDDDFLWRRLSRAAQLSAGEWKQVTEQRAYRGVYESVLKGRTGR